MDRRIIAGLLIGAAAVIGVDRLTNAGEVTAQQGGVAGRYQIVINPEVRADTFLLDTATGRTWKPVVFSSLEGDPVAWVYEDKLDDDAAIAQFRQLFRAKNSN